MAKNARIFIVEDDPLILLDIQKTLTQAGFEVIGTATTADDALAAIPKVSPDLVLMDIQLNSRIDGIEVARIVTNERQIPVIFLTGMTDEDTLRRAKLAMPYAYLVKPFDPIELSTTIELTLARAASAAPPEPVEADEIHFESFESDPSTKVEALSKIPLFNGVPHNFVAQIAEAASVRALESGCFIVNEEEDAQGGFIILSGRVSITKTSSSGKELIVSLLGAGDAFGMLYLLHGFNGSCSARAQVASKILWIPKQVFAILETGYPPIYRVLGEYVSKKLSSAFELAGSLAHARVEDRIITTLLALLPRLGHGLEKVGTGGGPRLYITRKELADLTGTTPETAIRITKNLEREGYLDLTRPGIIKVINLEGLRTMINS